MTNSKQTLSRWGKDAAAIYLQSLGYIILGRNIHTPHGELDIVARKDDLLLFVEVKTRSSHSFTYPEDTVTPRKQMHMRSAAEHYLDLEPNSPETWQFDVLAIERGPDREPVITLFENVIG
jgi:putative endonuclease